MLASLCTGCSMTLKNMTILVLVWNHHQIKPITFSVFNLVCAQSDLKIFRIHLSSSFSIKTSWALAALAPLGFLIVKTLTKCSLTITNKITIMTSFYYTLFNAHDVNTIKLFVMVVLHGKQTLHTKCLFWALMILSRNLYDITYTCRMKVSSSDQVDRWSRYQNHPGLCMLVCLGRPIDLVHT